MFFVYIIQSITTHRYYIGYTKNLEQRLYEHNHNNTQSLRNKGPYSLIYKEEFETITEARKRENKIKSYKGGNAFKKLIIKEV